MASGVELHTQTPIPSTYNRDVQLGHAELTPIQWPLTEPAWSLWWAWPRTRKPASASQAGRA